MVDSVFKIPKRIEALMMIMTLCLMVQYCPISFARSTGRKRKRYRIRLISLLKNPTMRWIFKLWRVLVLVRFYEKISKKPEREIITNLNELRRKLLGCSGDLLKIYGIVLWEIAGM